ncbi:1-(5-phosphoribosyl)-5-[(5-phosphoribosylamino)methylideneamino]imidazole-4-carboxamide isomerase [Metallumcola ferriviriculae]|uniref:1-(5-phosphoribosyl)-5-[(5-phosphoribosylamino)methylideneamino] imidazole-4-carboxamide isomerase n=1 Tax=Metallumcola ferriviriculae TaxID=3039180 RepID=A0AAU0UVV6_9FIRM|nr:1-(5-phosphoribosyl)-5-[(5-phosphoribosylamino)methylideneamino]imidazole-4-carboxamide isomerase [Desulfitibacteraceae bacterium MK1]
MLVIPAIDLREGRCVRLFQGKLDQETTYSHDPAEVALTWQEQGAKYLHLVDLDGAFAGEPKNMETVQRIIEAINIPVQLGGGIRTLSTVERLLKLGVDRVIFGTAAINNPDMVADACRQFGSERIVVGIDSKDGLVAVEGWATTVEKEALTLAHEIQKKGITRVVYTNTSLDGTLSGVDVKATADLAQKTGLKVIASGGVASAADIKNLKNTGVDIEGVILGKALYSGAITLPEALAEAEG